MRILVASHSYIVDINCEKLRILASLEPGIEVTIVVPKRWKPGGVLKDTIETCYREKGSFRVVPVSNFSQNNQGLLTFGSDLISLLKEFHPNIIQVEQGSKALAYTQLITLNRILKLKAKNLFFTWWNLPYHLKFPISLLEAYNLKHTNGIITGNQDGAKILRDRGYQGKLRVMPQLGVDDSLFSRQPQSELAAKLGIHSDDFVVGFAGRFVPEKGILTLIKSLEKLRDRRWKLLLLGRGALKPEIQQQAKKLGFSDRLIWIESVPHAEVHHYINLMNTLVLPSETTDQFKTLTSAGWKEQFGHVLIEAMACQIPVIGSDSGEIPNVIDRSGLVFPEGNVEELTNRLKSLMDNPSFAEELGQRGYQRVIAKYTNRALAKELLEFYRSL
ncbi:MAG: glycosyltransferase family 4 protein [Leptolyngbya sp. ERB_1_1]